MTTKEITVTLSESLLEIFGNNEDMLGRELCLLAAIKLYELRRVSLEKAAELAGKSPQEFGLLLGFYRSPSLSDGEQNKSLQNTSRQRDLIDELKANPIKVRNWVKLNREELHDRS